MARVDDEQAETQVEALAATFEKEKPYLMSAGDGRTVLRHNFRGSPNRLQRGGTMLQQIESALHASLARVLTLIATFLPAVFALILALGVGLLLGALLSCALHRTLTSLKLDDASTPVLRPECWNGPPSAALRCCSPGLCSGYASSPAR